LAGLHGANGYSFLWCIIRRYKIRKEGLAMSEKNYKVGKGKPPTKSQFKKGTSGNPSGRPKGSKNWKTKLMEALEPLILPAKKLKDTNTEVDSALKIIVAKTILDALKGDPKSRSEVLNLVKPGIDFNDFDDRPAERTLDDTDYKNLKKLFGEKNKDEKNE
jgi:hypothetical protein